MRFRFFGFSVVLMLLLSTVSWAQIDPEGRQYALRLYEVYQQSQGGAPFQQMFSQNPQMTKRAFVSTVEYATEVFQQDMQGAQQALGFAAGLSQGIAQQFGDPTPQALMERMMRQDYSVLQDFARYASTLHPGYAAALQQNGPGNYPMQNPGYQQNPGFPQQNPGYPAQNPGYPQQNPGYPAQNPGYPQQNPGYPAQNPGYAPGYPQQNPGYPAQNPGYAPGYPQQHPGYPAQNPGYAPGYPQQNPGYPPQNQGYPQTSDPFRPGGATGGPQRNGQ